MGNMLISALLMIYAVASFGFSYAYCGVQRCFYGLYGGKIEASVVAYDGNGDPVTPYFDKWTFRHYVDSYFEQTMPYTVDYELSYVFADGEMESQMDGKPSIAQVRVKASLLPYFEFDKTATFRIVEGE